MKDITWRKSIHRSSLNRLRLDLDQTKQSPKTTLIDFVRHVVFPLFGEGRPGVRVSDYMVTVGLALLHRGFAHPVKTWIVGEFVGALYEVVLGHMHYRESMLQKSRPYLAQQLKL